MLLPLIFQLECGSSKATIDMERGCKSKLMNLSKKFNFMSKIEGNPCLPEKRVKRIRGHVELLIQNAGNVMIFESCSLLLPLLPRFHPAELSSSLSLNSRMVLGLEPLMRINLKSRSPMRKQTDALRLSLGF
jgi:hypothetical protein